METARHIAATQLVVAPRRGFDRGSAVSVYIPRDADARIDVFPVRDAAQCVHVTRRRERSGRQIRSRKAHVDVVESQTQIERDASDRPRVLREQAQLDRLALLLEV